MGSGAARETVGTPAVYLFCLARRGRVGPVAGPGIEGGEVVQYALGDVMALVCGVPLESFTGPGSEARLQDLAWVGPRACRHEEVVEEAMRESPVFPARFGTLFSSEDRLNAFLERHYGTIAGFLDRMDGGAEYGVKGLLDRGAAEARWAAAQVPGDDRPSSPGARYLVERRMKGLAGKGVTAWVDRTATELLAGLRPHAADVRRLRPLSRQASGRDLEVVFNWAFLLEGNVVVFRSRVETLGAQYADHGLTLEFSGPWPAYNFCPDLEDSGGSGVGEAG